MYRILSQKMTEMLVFREKENMTIRAWLLVVALILAAFGSVAWVFGAVAWIWCQAFSVLMG
nr:MAG TPA: hypothetical protein [Caudoviricetes sp.]